MPAHTILITGASNGIGAALALEYAAPNTILGLIGRDAKRLNSVAQQCRTAGAQVETGLLDVTEQDELTTCIQQFDQQHPIDLLISSAGITSLIDSNGSPEAREQVQQVLDVNLHGTLNSIHAILDNMRERGQGQIALVSSLAAYRGMPITPAYSASKAAIKSYGEALRGLLAPSGLKINIICPGFVDSHMSQQFNAPKPFMIGAPKAAKIIRCGLQRNQAIISFPFPLNLGMWLVSILPFPLASFFLRLSGYNRT